MDVEAIYRDAKALLQGHFLLSSGNHSPNYLQSAKALENPVVAEKMAKELASQIRAYGIEVDTVCSPAIGGILAGYELARALGVRFIFAERAGGEMTLRRGFEVYEGERILVCEDIVTTGGSALEASKAVEGLGAKVVAYAALANRGFCARVGSDRSARPEAKLPSNLPLFALGDFEFPIYSPAECPLCKEGSTAVKPGSRGN